MDLIIRNARLLGAPEHPPVNIGVRGGQIIAIETNLLANAPVHDAEGNLVCAGLVETHIHLDKTRIIDRGHRVEAVFYSTDGAAIELRDIATLDTEILDGNTVLHSDSAQVHFYVVMTGAEDRWKVRVLESAGGPSRE